MHLGNSIICPVTGIPMILGMGIAAIWAFKKAKEDFSKEKLLPAIVLTLLVFAMQMINFSIPSTAASGHIIGAILLSVILGPYVAFLSICSILLVQGIFFADGGLMALGCNIFNMGFLACFVAYPFVYKLFNNKYLGILAASVAALMFGSIAVVIEGALSGSITNIEMFAIFMIEIHFVIAIVEGLVSGVILYLAEKTNLSKMFSMYVGMVSFVLAGIISHFASSRPDGLEWSLIKLSDNFVEHTQGQLYSLIESIQTKTAILININPIIANVIGFAIMLIVAGFIFSMLVKKEIKA